MKYETDKAHTNDCKVTIGFMMSWELVGSNFWAVDTSDGGKNVIIGYRGDSADLFISDPCHQLRLWFILKITAGKILASYCFTPVCTSQQVVLSYHTSNKGIHCTCFILSSYIIFSMFHTKCVFCNLYYYNVFNA